MNINEAYRLISQTLSEWLQNLVRLLPNILLAAVILVIGLFLAKKLKKLTARIFARVSPNATLTSLTSSVIHVIVICIILFTVLSILNLDKAVTSILAGAGIIGLALAFAFQDIAANFICGIFISFRKPFKIGHIVKVQDYMGKVVAINLRDTVIRTFQGVMVVIPNKDVFQNPIENFTVNGKRRVDLGIGVSYGDDLEKVEKVTLDAVKNLPNLAPGETTTLFFCEFADSSINFQLRIWVNSTEQIHYLKGCSDAIIRIKKAYDENDISIPFPIRTLDFGIKGGQTLREMTSGKESSASNGKPTS